MVISAALALTLMRATNSLIGMITAGLELGSAIGTEFFLHVL